ncbi:MAG: competence protein ComEA [Bacteroidota bacterium]|nr:competence protein ComEA [Bacteroidota bacterium]
MDFKGFIAKIQSVLGISGSELAAISILLSGLIIGVIVQNSGSSVNSVRKSDITDTYRLLDSIAERERTSFTGIREGKTQGNDAGYSNSIKEEKSFSKKKEFPSGKININTASISELCRLPGIGEATATKIINCRQNRRFNKISEIMLVKGIGVKKFEKIKDFISVE